MHFLLRATREITEGKRGIASTASKSSKKPWLPSKGFSRYDDEEKSIARARWTNVSRPEPIKCLSNGFTDIYITFLPLLLEISRGFFTIPCNVRVNDVDRL